MQNNKNMLSCMYVPIFYTTFPFFLLSFTSLSIFFQRERKSRRAVDSSWARLMMMMMMIGATRNPGESRKILLGGRVSKIGVMV